MAALATILIGGPTGTIVDKRGAAVPLSVGLLSTGLLSIGDRRWHDVVDQWIGHRSFDGGGVRLLRAGGVMLTRGGEALGWPLRFATALSATVWGIGETVGALVSGYGLDTIGRHPPVCSLPFSRSLHCCAPTLVEAFVTRKDESHGCTEEVPGRVAGTGDEDGDRGAAGPGRQSCAIKRIADQLGVHPEALRTWVRQAEIDGGHRPGVRTAIESCHHPRLPARECLRVQLAHGDRGPGGGHDLGDAWPHDSASDHRDALEADGRVGGGPSFRKGHGRAFLVKCAGW
ncbi:transposase [Rhodococcus opacus]|nr:transposase [Rhodococcus opacus]